MRPSVIRRARGTLHLWLARRSSKIVIVLLDARSAGLRSLIMERSAAKGD